LGAALLSHSSQMQLQGLMYGGTKVQLGLDDVREIFLAVPPLDEQIRIREEAASQQVKIRALEDKIREAMNRLREYRSALITAAVTGQLDFKKHEKQMEALA
ncbi:MAG TPA: hypothetical protein VFQ79_10170, partial [Bryobacteraceae bacterium]|nr:hypothetical protein [Bryobacteraceae bacterium]